MHPPIIVIEKEVSLIIVKRGEYLTVWLRDQDDPLRQIHVELRVMPDGTPYIFTDNLPSRSFEEWGKLYNLWSGV